MDRKPRELYRMQDAEVLARLDRLGVDKQGTTVYGVPRGGACAAQYLRYARPVAFREQADVILDDIVDSGATRKEYAVLCPGVPFATLVDKVGRKADRALGWVQFPWEDEPQPEDAVVRLLEYIGEDVGRDGLVGTPDRVCRALMEMTAGYGQDADEVLGRSFKSDHDEMIVSTGIRFASLCEHHLLPFTGVAAVGYIPKKGMVVGLSKLTRVIEVFSRRLQLQERLTDQVAQAMKNTLTPVGVGVIMRAHHSCMGCRGVNQPEAEMVTSSMLGAFRDKPEVRAEFLQLANL